MKIAFQGELGANSHIAIDEAYPGTDVLPCATFEDALAAISSGEADLGMIPIENSIAGRVADIHHLLPQANLHIIGEHFLPIHFQLMAPRGAPGPGTDAAPDQLADGRAAERGRDEGARQARAGLLRRRNLRPPTVTVARSSNSEGPPLWPSVFHCS